MTDVKEGTDWMVDCDNFRAHEIDRQRYGEPIKRSETLTIMRPVDDPVKVYFSHGPKASHSTKFYWTFRRIFLECCKPSSEERQA